MSKSLVHVIDLSSNTIVISLYSAYEKLKAMEQTLAKGKQIQDDCATIVKKLRAMLHSAEEQLRVHKKQTLYLTHLTAKTLPKGLHCLPLRLSTEYFRLNSSQQRFPNQENLEDPKLYHYALFSDNILAAAVVINSTVSHAKVNDLLSETYMYIELAVGSEQYNSLYLFQFFSSMIMEKICPSACLSLQYLNLYVSLQAHPINWK